MNAYPFSTLDLHGPRDPHHHDPDPLPGAVQLLNHRFQARLDERDTIFIRHYFYFYFSSENFRDKLLHWGFEELDYYIDASIHIFVAELGGLNKKINRLIREHSDSFEILYNTCSGMINLTFAKDSGITSSLSRLEALLNRDM